MGYDGEFYVDAGLISNGTTFISGGSSANVDFTSAASLTGGTNSFNLPVYVPYTLVPSLAGNTSFDQILITSATMPGGATLSLNLIGSNASMSYVFPNGFTVGSGAAVDVGTNVLVMLSAYQTLDDEGTVTFSTGDQMTVGYDGEFYVVKRRPDFQRRRRSSVAAATPMSTSRRPPSLTGGTNSVVHTAGLRSLHAGPIARGQYQLRSDLDHFDEYFQWPPIAQPDRQQREHELRVPQRDHGGFRGDGGRRHERARHALVLPDARR